jgi:hypothetical protein
VMEQGPYYAIRILILAITPKSEVVRRSITTFLYFYHWCCLRKRIV